MVPSPASRRRAKPEAAACGIGFLASRKGVAERALVDIALGLCRQFDHRGAPGHGAGLLLDIPWPLLLDRFPEHVRAVAQRDVALGMFFLPFDAKERRLCVETVEALAGEAGADVLGWADVPFNVEAPLPVGPPPSCDRPSSAGPGAWGRTGGSAAATSSASPSTRP
jgi:glutamate synthase domain-containing protein 1